VWHIGKITTGIFLLYQVLTWHCNYVIAVVFVVQEYISLVFKAILCSRFKTTRHYNLCDVGTGPQMICSEFLETTDVVSLWFVHNICFPTGKTGRLLFGVMGFKAEVQILPSLNTLKNNFVEKKKSVVTSRAVCLGSAEQV